MFRFEDPWWLATLVLVPLGYALRLRSGKRRAAVLTYPAVDIARETGVGVSRWARHVLSALRAVGLALFVVALARPQSGATTETVLTEGIDIVLAIDVSTSMLAEDLQPNRLEAAKAVAADFVRGRRSDRIALVAFAGEAFTQAPLTLDHGVITTLLGELAPGMITDGTAVGMGLATALKRLQASEAESKVVILLTDGQNNAGEIGPLTAAEMAEALGVRVYTIGAGTTGMARVPVDDPLRSRVYATVRVDIDEETLREMAELTGGRYFRATDNESLASIYDEIDRLERTEIEVENFTRYTERFTLAAGAGLLLVLLELSLAQTALRRLP